MKHSFLFRLFTAIVDGAGGTQQTEKSGATAIAEKIAPVVKIYSNDKIVGLKADLKTKWAEVRSFDEPDSDEAKKAMAEWTKIQADINAEIATLKAEDRRQEMEMKRNERIKIRVDFEAALKALYDDTAELEKIAVGKRTKERIEQNNILNDTVTKLRDDVDNELAAKYATSTPSKTATTGTVSTATKGGPTEILEAHLANVAAGMDDSASRKALEASGHARSTVWHTVNNYNKSKA